MVLHLWSFKITFSDILEHNVELLKSKYAKFLVKKLVKYG